MTSIPAWRNRLIIKHTPSQRIVTAAAYRDRCFVTLECGHQLDKPASELEGLIEVECRACGIERSNEWMLDNPEETEALRTGAIRPDGRPKPKFRSTKKQDKFLKKVQARHNAVFEPGQPATIEDD